MTFLLHKRKNDIGIPVDVKTLYIPKTYNHNQDDGTDIAFLVPWWRPESIPETSFDFLKFPNG